MVAVATDEIHKSFGAVKAVDGISFQIEEGETFGLLGPNGAGKSTTLNMLVGVVRPDSGTVRLLGDSDPARPQTRMAVGVVPQQLSLYEELTALENLKFFGRLYGLQGGRLAERTEWCLEFAGLSERRNHRVATYSGGMKRRLNMACALVHEPQIILMDEPTVGVDPQSRNHIFERIEQLKSTGKTILYTTHYMEEAQRLCNRVGVMDHGQLLALGTVEHLIDEYGGMSVVVSELQHRPQDVDLPGTLDDHHLRFESHEPLETISRLAAQGVVFRTLNLQRPDLETVFLALTGRRLRDS